VFARFGESKFLCRRKLRSSISGVDLRLALGTVIRAMGGKEFAARSSSEAV
jgi:hypothetical protein